MFSLNEVQNVLQTLANERPDYVYTDANVFCTYADRQEDAPSCIIGNALHKLGASIHDLRELDEAPNAAIDVVRHPFVRDNFDTTTRAYMRDVQRKQDKGYSWSDAVRYADQELLRFH